MIYLIGETFLENVEKFKLYSTFCSCHSRAVKLLELSKFLNYSFLAYNLSLKSLYQGRWVLIFLYVLLSAIQVIGFF